MTRSLLFDNVPYAYMLSSIAKICSCIASPVYISDLIGFDRDFLCLLCWFLVKILGSCLLLVLQKVSVLWQTLDVFDFAKLSQLKCEPYQRLGTKNNFALKIGIGFGNTLAGMRVHGTKAYVM